MFKEGSRCCSLEDVERARAVCEHLGIRHYVVNAVEQFEERIIDRFVSDYASGRTPSPCILCNEHIKFGTLHHRATQLDCTHVATGHYARVEHRGGAWRLLRPRDRAKDQTYFLHRLSQRQLERCLFPLEGWTKSEAARYAAEQGLPVRTSSKEESQDLCFVPDDGHARFVEERSPAVKQTGDIVDTAGRVLGHHQGIHRYTLGQRRGLGVAAGTPLYVQRLDASGNKVVVAARHEVMSEVCILEDMHWIRGTPPRGPMACLARVRYRHVAAPVQIEPRADGRVKLVFKDPQFAITPGQAAVLYDGEEILGGGWIRGPESFEV